MPIRAINGLDVNCSWGCGHFALVPRIRGETTKKTKQRIEDALTAVESHESTHHTGNPPSDPDMLKLYLAVPMIARNYVDSQHSRISAEHRLRRMRDLNIEVEDPLYEAQMRQFQRTKSVEISNLDDAKLMLSGHPLWEYCEIVKGWGPVACMTWMGYIDPFKAHTAGRVKKYLGIIPESGLKKGQTAGYNLEAKGRTYIVMNNTILQKDPHYYDLYIKKKTYYAETERDIDGVVWPPFNDIIDSPEICPNYPKCAKKLISKAEREGRKPKKPSCRAHLNNMARRWLWGLLASNAAEIMRVALNLPVDNYKAHDGYLGPKLIKDW